MKHRKTYQNANLTRVHGNYVNYVLDNDQKALLLY